MIDETLVQMWNILKENDFQIDLAVKSKILCTSCKNILIKPCNVPCGCRYCHNCIISYLNGEVKFCLGESDYCKHALIKIDENVFPDQAVHRKISRIVVKCPLESCEFKTELGKMADHIGKCEKQPVTCPYHSIGCDENKIGVDKMKQHLKQENYCHTRLLMDFVDNWKNEMKLLKTNVLSLQEENKCIKEQMVSNQNTILALEENVAKLLKENRSLKELETEKSHQNNQIKEIILAIQTKAEEQNQGIKVNTVEIDENCNQIVKHQGQTKTRIDKISQEIADMTKKSIQIENTMKTLETQLTQLQARIEKINLDNKSLREELEIIKLDNKIKERIISALQTKLEEEEQEKCKFLEENQEQIKTRIEELLQENRSLRNELETVKQNQTKQVNLKLRFDEKCNQIEKNQEQMKMRIDKMSQENADMTTKSKQIETKLIQTKANQNCGEFLWCIQNWEEKKKRARNGTEKEIYSDPFYSHKNGYKMCLELDPDYSGHLYLDICIMRGEFDNILQWPFRHGVKLDLLNQETGLAHVSRNVCYGDSPTSDAWKKPTRERNNVYGYYGLHPFIEISELSSNAALCLGDKILIRATPQMKL